MLARIDLSNHRFARRMLVWFIAAGVLGWGATTSRHAQAAGPKAEADVPAEQVELRGRVLGPDGKPVEGARLYLSIPNAFSFQTHGVFTSPPRPSVRAVTGPEGGFRFTVGQPEIDVELMGRKCFGLVSIVAMGPADVRDQPSGSYGLDFAPVFAFDPSGELVMVTLAGFPGSAGAVAKYREPMLRLVKDDVPLTGRILNTNGQPVAGATISVRDLWVMKKDDLTGFLNAVQNEHADYDRARAEYKSKGLGGPLADTDLQYLLSATSDREGKFKVSGIGRERIACFFVEGPGIQPGWAYAYTRPGSTLDIVHAYHGTPLVRPGNLGGSAAGFTFHGATFEHVAPISIPIVGTVRDVDTGEPLAGARVQSYRFAGRWFRISPELAGLTRTVTDEQGRYRLDGMPIGKENQIIVIPPLDQPYLPSLGDVDIPADKDRVQADVKLKRGIWIRGRVTEVGTGNPVPAFLHYYVFLTNPHHGSVPDLHGALFKHGSFYMTDKDGRYAVRGFPDGGWWASLPWIRRVTPEPSGQRKSKVVGACLMVRPRSSRPIPALAHPSISTRWPK